MPLVTTTEMFKKAYEGGYAVGAFNVNNMELVQGITSCAENQFSADFAGRLALEKYANHTYLVKLVEAALQNRATFYRTAFGRPRRRF